MLLPVFDHEAIVSAVGRPDGDYVRIVGIRVESALVARDWFSAVAG